MALHISFYFGLMFLCFQMCVGDGSHVSTDHQGIIETACRDRYFWVSVYVGSAGRVPRFEAVVGNTVHIIKTDHASMCGYTINHLDGRATLKASYFSCHTENQNDIHFLFKLNVVLTDDKGKKNKYSLSETCTLPVNWSAKEVLCAENYVEVTVAKDAPCTSEQKSSKENWLAALALAQRSAISEWQVMFLNSDNIASMSISDARQMGYMVDSTPKRAVFRSAYNQPHSTITQIEGIDVEVIQIAVFFRQKWAVVLLDTSAACTIAPSIFDGVSLHWRTPKLMKPLVQDRSGFVSKSIELGVEAQLLDEDTRKAMGYMLTEDGNVVYASVPFAAPGGYRRSLLENNIYKESYMVFLCYQHIFSHMFTDGTEIDTRHRQLRVLETPLISRIPFTRDETLTHEEVFTVYLGNFAPDVQLIGVKLNENYTEITDAIQQYYFITKIPHINGTHGIIIKVPFEDRSVNRVYLGEGVLQYSLEITYTLNIIGQHNTFYHNVSVMSQIYDAFPPDITATCTPQSIIFHLNHVKRAGLWEICVGHQTLTTDLSKMKGYILKNDSHSMTLEAPLFTSGYIYENVTLKNFVGIFELLIRDSKTLEIHRRTVKRCLFPTYELTVCSPDGIMTVVTTTTESLPMVPPSSTTLLDRKCRPKSTDETRVMFTFGVTTCGTRLMVGDGYIVYENEIVSDRGVVIDREAAITRESKFRLTVRCFYPLKSVNRVFIARLFEKTGYGTLGTQVTDNTVLKGPQENLISSHTATVFEPNPWPNKPCRSCAVTDKENTQLLQRGVPHAAYYLPDQGRKTSEHGYHGNDISHQHKRASQPEKSYRQTTTNVHIPQSKEISVLTGGNNAGNNFYKRSDWITSNTADYYRSNNEVSDQPYLREYIDRYTSDRSFQHFPDISPLFNNNPSKAFSLVDHTNKTQNTAVIYDNEDILNKRTASLIDQGQKQLGGYILPTFNINRQQFEENESSAQPLKDKVVKTERLQKQRVEKQNSMHEDYDYSAKKISKLLQWLKENKDSDFILFENTPVILKSSGKPRRTFFKSGGRSRYGPSIHDGILRG